MGQAVAPGARRSGRRWGLGLLLLALLLVVPAAGAASWALRASLPRLDGVVALPGLSAPVRVERDALGVPTVRGATRQDVARATGFLHAQDRFFQMDLLRRRSAGELSELAGAGTLPLDRGIRRYRLRAVARRALEALPAGQRALLEAYAAGVGAGLASLGSRPWEYLLLRARPAPWRAEDSLLVVLTMFVDLTGEGGARDATLGALRDTLPAPFLELLAPAGGEWDAPLQGGPLSTPPLPGPEVLDLRKRPGALGAAPHPAVDEPDLPGSNGWVVDGRHSAGGGALVADDMHLGHAVPNIWYRASLAWSDDGEPRRLTGVTLPGLPAVVAGSNGHVAWGFTNSYGDWQDLIELEPAPGDPGAYLAPGGVRPLERCTELIRVKGGADVALEVLDSEWGPVVSEDARGRRRALAWTALRPGGVDLGLLALERARDLGEALDAANAAGIPPQNFMAGDAAGHVGWTIAGRLPRRVGLDGRLPTSWADGTRRWDGWWPPAETPRLVDPPSGRLWTANSRVVEGEALERIGDGGYALGARARQIRDDLMARERFDERDLLGIQLDDRALFLARWQALLLGALDAAALGADPRRAEVRRLVEAWGARAAVGSVGYRLVRAWRLAVTARALAPFLAEARRALPRLEAGDLLQAEGFAWRLVTERPAHLLAPGEGSWDRLLLAALDDVLAALPEGGRHLAARTWGEANTAAIRHPLSPAVPGLGRLVDMPPDPLAGDANLPRVERPAFGASERFVVSPGREEEGIFHMPGGQSGHPLSPYYRAGHAAWVEGHPTPFLPGPAVHVLDLSPGGP
jgi:penicillin amidase